MRVITKGWESVTTEPVFWGAWRKQRPWRWEEKHTMANGEQLGVGVGRAARCIGPCLEFLMGGFKLWKQRAEVSSSNWLNGPWWVRLNIMISLFSYLYAKWSIGVYNTYWNQCWFSTDTSSFGNPRFAAVIIFPPPVIFLNHSTIAFHFGKHPNCNTFQFFTFEQQPWTMKGCFYTLV